MHKLSKKTLKIAGATAVLLAGGGLAYGYWTNTGTGVGTATTGTNAGVTVVQTASGAVLVPGGPASTLSGTFTNTNTSTVFVNTVTATLASVTGSVGTPACTVADYQLDTATITVNAQAATTDDTPWTGIRVSMVNSGTNQDACKNATINLGYTSN